ncbi:jg14206 [Pararge aegeria aegeria]|uniref:Jg14206 protein n=1 Tax=Pararge aegeria aegeria TaxID=348720 RepID=A0A8S4QN43_9NEOP|nr:jg14206 [Pararge aegeria aegeria]
MCTKEIKVFLLSFGIIGTPQTSPSFVDAPGEIKKKCFFFNRHIQEHMDVPIDTSKMSDQELQFHYFKMHDADNNNKLDGCELIKSLIHWHGEDLLRFSV